MNRQKIHSPYISLLLATAFGCSDKAGIDATESPPADSGDTGASWQWGSSYSFDAVLAQCLSLVTGLSSETLCENYPTDSDFDIESQETCQEIYESFSRDITDLTAGYAIDTIHSVDASVETWYGTYFSISEDGTEDYTITVPSTFYSITFIDLLGHSVKCSTSEDDFSAYGLPTSFVTTNLCYMLSGEGTLRYYDPFCRDASTGEDATNSLSITHVPNLDSIIPDSFFSEYSNITISSGLSSSQCDDFIDDGRTTYSPDCPGFFTTTIAAYQEAYNANLESLVLAGDPIVDR